MAQDTTTSLHKNCTRHEHTHTHTPDCADPCSQSNGSLFLRLLRSRCNTTADPEITRLACANTLGGGNHQTNTRDSVQKSTHKKKRKKCSHFFPLTLYFGCRGKSSNDKISKNPNLEEEIIKLRFSLSPMKQEAHKHSLHRTKKKVYRPQKVVK